MNQNVNEHMPEDLSRAINSIVAMNVPAESVQRVIDQSVELAATKSSNPSAVPSLSTRRYQYLMWICCAFAFLTPIAFKLLKGRLDLLPGWENPIVRVFVVALVAFAFAGLAWSFGQSIIGTIEKRSASKVRWLANVATLVVFGLVLSSLMAGPRSLYAQMQEAIAKVKTIQYVTTMSDAKTEQEISRTQNYLQGSDLMRVEMGGKDDPMTMTMIMDLNQKKTLTLDQQAKTAELAPIYRVDAVLENWKKADYFLRGTDLDGRLIGESKVNGRLCSDFEVLDDGVTSTISIDQETKLPLQMKMVTDDHPEFVSVANQFVFDQPLDPKLFSMTVPEGYTATVIERKEPVDDSGLVLVPGENFGSAKFGMTTEELIEVFGQPDKISDSDDLMILEDGVPEDGKDALELLNSFAAQELSYNSRGFILLVQKEKGLISVSCFGMTMGNGVFQGQLPGGIKMGDSPAGVRKVFGEPTRKPNLSWGESKTDLNYKTANGSTLRFAFEDSKLVLVINRKKD